MKKVFHLLTIALLISGSSFAQNTKPAIAKTFGGRDQYKTFSIGVNTGALAPVVLIGGTNDYTNWDADFGYGVYLRKQLSHVFGLQGNLLFGDLSGNNNEAPGGSVDGFKSYKTKIAYGVDIRGTVNLGSVNFLNRTNAINFTGSAGLGLLAYALSYVNSTNTNIDWKGKAEGGNDYIKEAYFPVGIGMKFKVSDAVSFNLDYVMNFVDGDNLDASYAKSTSKDKFSYSSIGLEFALGSKSKPNIIWANPVETMYNELKDNSLREDLLKLQARTKKVEDTVVDLKKDSDEDGVADHLDKCADTPKTTNVDGAGCPLIIPKK